MLQNRISGRVQYSTIGSHRVLKITLCHKLIKRDGLLTCLQCIKIFKTANCMPATQVAYTRPVTGRCCATLRRYCSVTKFPYVLWYS